MIQIFAHRFSWDYGSSPFRYYCLSIIKDNSLVQVYKLARQGGWEEEFPYQCSTF